MCVTDAVGRARWQAWSSGRRYREQGRVQTHREGRTTHSESADDDRGLLSNQGPRSRVQKGQQKYLTHDGQEAPSDERHQPSGPRSSM